MITAIIHRILCLGCSPLPISLTTRVVCVSQMALHPVVSRHVYCWGEGQEAQWMERPNATCTTCVKRRVICVIYVLLAILCKWDESGHIFYRFTFDEQQADRPLFFLIYWKVQLNLFRSIIWIVWDVQDCDMYAERMWQCIHVLERCNWIRSVCVCVCVCVWGGGGSGESKIQRKKRRKGWALKCKRASVPR